MRTSQDRPTESCAAVYVNVTLSRRIVTIQNQICSTRRDTQIRCFLHVS